MSSRYNKNMSLFGTDQSKWQAYVDPTCDTKYQMNKAAGKLLGVYHFARPDLNDAVPEAQFFVASIRGYLNEAVLALDWEQPGTQNNVSWAKAWLDEVYRLTGIKPLIYMSASVVSAYDWRVVANSDYGLWIAGYPDLRSSWDLPDFCYSTGAWNYYTPLGICQIFAILLVLGITTRFGSLRIHTVRLIETSLRVIKRLGVCTLRYMKRRW